MTTVEANYCYKCGLFFTDTGVIAVRLGSNDENMADENYMTWIRVVESVNQNNISLVDYSIKDVPVATATSPVSSTSYDDIKSVTILKAPDTGNNPVDDQFRIDFSTGMFNMTSYFIPAATLQEALDLLNKTPLASKIKAPS